jgi:transposase-like protein
VKRKRKPLLRTRRNLTLAALQAQFPTDEDARQYLEDMRWPDGVHCPQCRKPPVWKFKGSREKTKLRAGLWGCHTCQKQFTVTVGTIFEHTHVPLQKWLVACFLVFSSKKTISSLELQRRLKLGSYHTALSVTRRIRSAIPKQSLLLNFDEKMRHLLCSAGPAKR